MDWIVFGDDWGGHPSTTQHLVLNLPAQDKVVWIDSIGMRQPTVQLADARRVWGRARGLLRTAERPDRLYPGSVQTVERITPKALPWHLHSPARRFNACSLGRSITQSVRRLAIHNAVVLTSNPVVAFYLAAVPHTRTAYLRLDDYAKYPGVDPRLVQQTEQMMFAQASTVFATAKALLPGDPFTAKGHYLPQGVPWEHFAQVPREPPRTKILGFFGTLAEWLDYKLIAQVAQLAPDWILEFVGTVDHLPDHIGALPNVRIRPAVPFRELPSLLAEWSAAWIPFQLTPLTLAVNPLKVREYLAAGLPTHCTPLPEVAPLAPVIEIAAEAERVVEWMRQVRETDTADMRRHRRDSVKGDSWSHRSQEMRTAMASR